MSTALGHAVVLQDTAMDAAEERVRGLLAEQGFGILTEINVAATFKKKLDVDIPGYKILGACNPKLAHQAIGIMPEVGLLLPCNVVVREVEGGTEVSLVNPDAMLGVAGDALSEVAADAGARLGRVFEALQA